MNIEDVCKARLKYDLGLAILRFINAKHEEFSSCEVFPPTIKEQRCYDGVWETSRSVFIVTTSRDGLSVKEDRLKESVRYQRHG